MAGIYYVVLCIILMKKMNLSVNAAGDNFGNGSEHAIRSPEFPACKQYWTKFSSLATKLVVV